ncbi:MAG: flippase-like domain-containing protein [Saprospiraceae bacterium]|nr:flippase-like domain-containing protein [Saprospiraceae bacterium]MCZ2337494.1 flippase-like domain-containing protein [Chitinophagales bacterium]
MKEKFATIAKIVVFFGLGIGILYLVFARQSAAYQADCALKGIAASECSLTQKIINDVSHADYRWIVLTILLFILSNVFRALRWKMMIEAIGYRPRFINLFGTIMINYLANLTIPRSGELIRAGMISKYENIPVEKAFGTIVTDRLFDVIMLAIVIGLALMLGGSDFINYLNQNVDISSRFAAFFSPNRVFLMMAMAIICASLVYKNKSRIRTSMLGQKIIQRLKGFATGVQSVRYVSSIPLFIFYTLGIWILYYLMSYWAFFSFEPTAHLGPVAGLVVFTFGSLGILIPTPGGMGSYHYLVGEALAIYGVEGADAFSLANIIFFSIQIFVNIAFGLLALSILPALNKKRKHDQG